MQWDATLTFMLAGNDITAYVRSWDVQRGRANNAQPVQPGVAVLTLDNTDRRFEPGYISGAYYPDIAPHATLSIKATHSATDYWLFHGYVEAFPVQWSVDGDTDSIVQIRAFDYLSILHRTATPTPYRQRVLADNPMLLFLMEEYERTHLIDHRGNVAGLLEGTYTLGQAMPGGLDYDHNGVFFDHGRCNFGPVRQLDMATGNMSIEFWFAAKDLNNGSGPIAVYSNAGNQSPVNFQGDTQWFVSVDDDAGGAPLYLYFGWHHGDEADGGAAGSYGPEGNPEDADVYWQYYLAASGTALDSRDDIHVVITRNVTTQTVRFYVDGVEVVPTQFGAWVDPPSLVQDSGDNEYSFVIGGYPYNSTTGLQGIVSHFAIYDRLLSRQQVANHYAASIDRWKNQNAGARINDILDVAGWSASARDIDTGGTPNLDVTPIDGTLSLLQQAQQTARTADGIFYHAPNGYSTSNADRMAFQGKDNRYNATVASTWKDGTPNNRYHTLTWGVNDASLFNEILIDDGEKGALATSATQITNYGKRTLSLTAVPADSDTHLDDLADWLLTRHKLPVNTFLTMTIKPQRSDVTWGDALSLDVSDLVRIIRTPVGGGTALDHNCFIESVRHSGNARGEWLITVTLTLGDTYEVFEVADVTYGELGAYPLAL